MAKSVDLVQLKLDPVKAQLIADSVDPDFTQQLKAAVDFSRTNTRIASPTARLGWLNQALTELGLDTGYLSPAQNLASRAAGMQRKVIEQQQLAAKSRSEAVRRIVVDPTAPLDDVASVSMATWPWLVAEPGQRSAAAELVYQAGRMIESSIDGKIASCGEQIFALLQGKARHLVAEVAALPKLPQAIWRSAAPDEDLGRIPVHRSTWGVLLAAYRDFEAVHRVAEQIRDGLGLGPDSLPDGAPRSALAMRNWRLVLENSTEFDSLKKPLRLPYAIEHGFEPGLWRPEDVKTRPTDRTFKTKLQRFGSAVMGSPAA